jgi:hypothetical protein
MPSPSKKTLSAISKCLDELIDLQKNCEGTQLPEILRKHGMSVLTNMFNPQHIDSSHIEDMKEELYLMNEILGKQELITALAKWLKATGQDVSILRNVGQTSIINKHVDRNKLAKELVQEQSIDKKPPPDVEQYLDKKERFSAWELTDGIETSRHTYQNYTRQASTTPHSVERLTNQEMQSRLDEKRLDGSPDPFSTRDRNHWGSHSAHDDYTDNANP